jgi:Helix-turn-helix domain
VHLIFERGEGLVYGLSRRPFRRELTGRDRVFGVKFRPAAFAPFLAGPMGSLTERQLGFPDFFGRGARTLSRSILGADDTNLLPPIEQLLTVRQVAEMLGVCTATAYFWAASSALPHIRIVNVIRVRPDDLAHFIVLHDAPQKTLAPIA